MYFAYLRSYPPRDAYMHQWLGSALVHYPNQCWAIVNWTNISQILIKTQNFSFTKMLLKSSSWKWRPFWPGGGGGDKLIYVLSIVEKCMPAAETPYMATRFPFGKFWTIIYFWSKKHPRTRSRDSSGWYFLLQWIMHPLAIIHTRPYCVPRWLLKEWWRGIIDSIEMSCYYMVPFTNIN